MVNKFIAYYDASCIRELMVGWSSKVCSLAWKLYCFGHIRQPPSPGCADLRAAKCYCISVFCYKMYHFAGRHNECSAGLQYQPRQCRVYKWSICILPWSKYTKNYDIKNNAWVTVNNDFWVTSEAICQKFSVTKSRVKIIGKSHHEWPKNRYSR